MKTKHKIAVIIVIIFSLIFALYFIINFSLIQRRIYYKTNYKGEIPDSETLIEKSESFPYEKHCKYRGYSGEVHNVSEGDHYYHIDRQFIDSLIETIDQDKQKFHLYPFFRHNLNYTAEATEEPMISLRYNNNSIIRAQYSNNSEIFSAQEGYFENGTSFWMGNWFLNFTQIPYVKNSSYLIDLKDVLLVKMNVEYHYEKDFGVFESLTIKQFLCFDTNFHAIFVYFPIAAKIVS